MEDYYRDFTLEKSGLRFLGIFDGHGGSACAEFLCDNLHLNLDQRLSEEKTPLHKETIIQVFQETDRQFFDNEFDLERRQSGSTAVVLLVDERNRRAVIANVGDSMAVLSRTGNAVRLSVEHRVSNPVERKRILKAGADVIRERLDGVLEFTRAFGNARFKYMNLAATQADDQKALLAIPNVTEFELTDEDDFIVLASDGLWDFMKDEDVVSFVRERLAPPAVEAPWYVCGEARKPPPPSVAALLCTEARDERKSTDNISVAVCALQHSKAASGTWSKRKNTAELLSLVVAATLVALAMGFRTSILRRMWML